MNDFKSKKELLDYLKASPENHIVFEECYHKEHWKDGGIRYAIDGMLVTIGHHRHYRKVPKYVMNAEEKATELIKRLRELKTAAYAKIGIAIAIDEIKKVFELEEK